MRGITMNTFIRKNDRMIKVREIVQLNQLYQKISTKLHVHTVASLGLVSPGAANDGVTLLFP